MLVIAKIGGRRRRDKRYKKEGEGGDWRATPVKKYKSSPHYNSTSLRVMISCNSSSIEYISESEWTACRYK